MEATYTRGPRTHDLCNLTLPSSQPRTNPYRSSSWEDKGRRPIPEIELVRNYFSIDECPGGGCGMEWWWIRESSCARIYNFIIVHSLIVGQEKEDDCDNWIITFGSACRWLWWICERTGVTERIYPQDSKNWWTISMQGRSHVHPVAV